jgi:hypothetical protein
MMKGVAGSITEWVRPHVPEASDGILTSAGICEGFAGAGVSTKVLIFAGFAGLVAGTLAAAPPSTPKQVPSMTSRGPAVHRTSPARGRTRCRTQ